MSYAIDSKTPLRDVYLMWLIALDPKAFLEENNLDWRIVSGFHNQRDATWGEFEKLRKEQGNING